MDHRLLLLLGILRSACRCRADLVLENLALRHQLGVLMQAGRRPRVTAADRGFRVVLRRLWRRAFLRNHRDAVAAMDFLVVPPVRFRVLYVWSVIEHGRRRIVHFT